MFGLFKKKLDSNALIFTFLQLVSPLLERHGGNINFALIENKLNEYLNYSNTKLSQDQLMTLKYASQILCMNEELQEKILRLHHASEQETKEKFLEVLDDFQSCGCFC